MNQIRLACRACILAGLGAAVLALGAAQMPAASGWLRAGRVPGGGPAAEPVRACY
jgi:hypothetical protein